MAKEPLDIRLLGALSVRRGSQTLELPPSKKTRALLAYLVLTGREHRRERLCGLFWDVTDDPRGALRWSLSRLRPLLDEPGVTRLAATRDTVAFMEAGAQVDLLVVRRALAQGPRDTPTEALRTLAESLRGEALEGLDLPDFDEYQSWCLAEREQVRALRSQVLGTLVERLDAVPEAALPHARALVQTSPLDEEARVRLITLLGRLGRRAEAEQQYRAARRLLAEDGGGPRLRLDEAWDRVRGGGPGTGARVSQQPTSPAPAQEAVERAAAATPAAAATGLVGRRAELEAFGRCLRAVVEHRQLRALLLTGEPGAGKTRLLAEMRRELDGRGGTVLNGAAYEAERGRPYGPWIDALRSVPASAMGDAASSLALLLPELAAAREGEPSRERLFGAVADLVAARAHSAPPVLVIFDDVHWLDPASAALLHYVARMSRSRPVLVALAARGGELNDNARVLEVVRGLRREQALAELRIGPLDADEIAQLVRGIAPTLQADGILAGIIAESAGNPLYALELARAGRAEPEASSTLADLVRDRLDKLPVDAAEILGWAALLGPRVSAALLDDLSGLGIERLIAALGALERHAFLRALGEGGEGADYGFVHEAVKRVVLTDLSEPRRRLMHRRIARLSAERAGANDSHAAEIAHHAALAGEAALAARACVDAARRCLRLFANEEAEALVRRGLRQAERLDETDRVRLTIELEEVRYRARRPEDVEQAAHSVEDLARQALGHGSLEHARLGFQVVSQMRWEGGEWTAAHKNALHAEFVSRGGDDRERARAMAEAGRCLALLERDLPQAEALALQAKALGEQRGYELYAVPVTLGMLRLHQGDLEEAARSLEAAVLLAQRDRDQLAEFNALEQLVIAELRRDNAARAHALCSDLVRIGEKIRAGSELPFARALAALCATAVEGPAGLPALEQALDELEQADAKHRLAFTLTRAALLDLGRGDAARARAHADRALRAATQAGRPSEIALARVALVRAAQQLGDTNVTSEHTGVLRRNERSLLSREAREAVDSLLDGGSRGEGGGGLGRGGDGCKKTPIRSPRPAKRGEG